MRFVHKLDVTIPSADITSEAEKFADRTCNEWDETEPVSQSQMMSFSKHDFIAGVNYAIEKINQKQKKKPQRKK